MIFRRDKKTWENPSEEVYLSPHSCSDGTPQRAGIRELGSESWAAEPDQLCRLRVPVRTALKVLGGQLYFEWRKQAVMGNSCHSHYNQMKCKYNLLFILNILLCGKLFFICSYLSVCSFNKMLQTRSPFLCKRLLLSFNTMDLCSHRWMKEL